MHVMTFHTAKCAMRAPDYQQQSGHGQRHDDDAHELGSHVARSFTLC